MGNHVRKAKVPRQGRTSAEGLGTYVTEVKPGSGQHLYLSGIGDGGRRRPTPEDTPKGGLLEEKVEAKTIQRERNLHLLTVGVPKVGNVLPDGTVPTRAGRRLNVAP
eukprot:3776729-Prorocentrum_lima.AAC.1